MPFTKQAQTRSWTSEQNFLISIMETTGCYYTVSQWKAHSLKDIHTQIKTLSLLNKLITSEQDSLDWSIFRMCSRQSGLESCTCSLKKSLCLARACEEDKKLVFYKGWKMFFLAWKKTTLLFMSGFYTIWACTGTMWQWCHNNSHFKGNVCFYPATMWVLMDTANTNIYSPLLL